MSLAPREDIRSLTLYYRIHHDPSSLSHIGNVFLSFHSLFISLTPSMSLALREDIRISTYSHITAWEAPLSTTEFTTTQVPYHTLATFFSLFTLSLSL
jgi:hypothetical protein